MEQMSAGSNDENSEELELKVASMKYIERVVDGILASLNPKANGSEVTMSAEVLVGPVQLGLLASTFGSYYSASRAIEVQAEGQNNLKEIGLAFHNYHDRKKSFPASASYDKEGKPLLSWRVHILPEIGEEALYKEFHLDEPWDSEHNKKLIERMPAIFKHPQFDEAGKTIYMAVVGKGAAFEGKEGRKLPHFTDGTSMTIMVVEVAAEKAVPWTQPADWEFDPEKEINAGDFGGPAGGPFFNVLYADGHVESFFREFDVERMKKMFTRAGGEVVDPLPPPIAAPAPVEIQQ
jgi:prepilin-type processing-associated H-X9-DG protein